MEIFSGLSVSQGIAIGKARIVKQKRLEIANKKIETKHVPHEVNRFEALLGRAIKETDRIIEEYSTTTENKEILESHKMILKDPELKSGIINILEKELVCLEQALHRHFTKIITYFESLDNEIFSQKATDYRDVSNRLISILIGRKGTRQISFNEDEIPFFYKSTPSQIVRLHKQGVKGFYLHSGSITCHNAIIARSFGLVSIVNIEEIFNHIKSGDQVILDGFDGKIIIKPTEDVLNQYLKKLSIELKHRDDLKNLINVKPQLILNKEIGLELNVEIPEEIESAQNLNVAGIGLFRTEFLFMERVSLPDEEEQFNCYKEMAIKMGDKPVVIRTFDLGGDKFSGILQSSKEDNPFLGNRGLRFSLSHPNIFRKQINAILRASVYGNIKMMFPMVLGVEEFLQAKEFVLKVMSNLKNKGYKVNENIEIGVMIEIPSAAICADALAKEVDFFSIGTNDLVQYTLSIDRTNQSITKYYIPHHPAVIALIKNTCVAANKHNIPVTVCGAMASETKYIPMLLAFGVDNLSIAPSSFLDAKKCVLSLNDEMLIRLKNFDYNTSATSIDNFLKELTDES